MAKNAGKAVAGLPDLWCSACGQRLPKGAPLKYTHAAGGKPCNQVPVRTNVLAGLAMETAPYLVEVQSARIREGLRRRRERLAREQQNNGGQTGETGQTASEQSKP